MSNPTRLPVTIVVAGNEPLRGFLYWGNITVIEKKKRCGRIRLANGDVASFNFGNVVIAEDRGAASPFLGNTLPEPAFDLGVGASVVCLLGVDQDDRLLVLKMTPHTEFARVRKLIRNRQVVATMIPALTQRFPVHQSGSAPNGRHGLRPGDREMLRLIGAAA